MVRLSLKTADLLILDARIVKAKQRYEELSEEEAWRVGLVLELLHARSRDKNVDVFQTDEIENMLSFSLKLCQLSLMM